MFKTYNLFVQRDINDLIPEIVYLYLFDGLSLTAIENKLLNTDTYHGWLSKSLLNFHGIDTEGENKGIYSGKSLKSIIDELYSSHDLNHIMIAKLLSRKYV